MGIKRAESLEDLRKKGQKAQKAKATKRLSQSVAVKDWHEAVQVQRDAPNPSPWQKMVAAYARQPYSTQLFVNFLLAMTVLGLCTAMGGFVFFALEKKQACALPAPAWCASDSRARAERPFAVQLCDVHELAAGAADEQHEQPDAGSAVVPGAAGQHSVDGRQGLAVLDAAAVPVQRESDRQRLGAE